MSVLTLPTTGDASPALRPLPWRRMVWVTWRQHRPALIGLAAVLAAVAVFLLIAGLRVHHDDAVLRACHPASSAACQALGTSFSHGDWTLANTVLILMNLAPALIGAFAGAPVLARELETGTFRFAWTQGFGRARWAAAKLVLLAVVVTALAWVFSQVFDWFFSPFIGRESITALSATSFSTHGIAFAAWTLAAFTIAAFAGLLIRRTVPAMAVTLGTYLGLAILTWLVLRPHYLPATVTSNLSADSGNLTGSSPWVLRTWITGPGGHPAGQAIVQALQQAQHGGPPPSLPPGYTQWISYISVSRFWPMQLIEGGWLLALSMLLIVAAVVLVRRRGA
jgi:hypothetical protein